MTFTPFGDEPFNVVMRPPSMVTVVLRSTPPRPSNARSVRRTTDWAWRADPRTRSEQAAEARISTVSGYPAGGNDGVPFEESNVAREVCHTGSEGVVSP